MDKAPHIARKFAVEVNNPRDGAARWLSVIVLGQVREVSPEMVRQVLQRALREEPNRENLRAIGSVLAGSDRSDPWFAGVVASAATAVLLAFGLRARAALGAAQPA